MDSAVVFFLLFVFDSAILNDIRPHLGRVLISVLGSRVLRDLKISYELHSKEQICFLTSI